MSTQRFSGNAFDPIVTAMANEICPLCEQAIPQDKLVEIQQRERQRAVIQEQKLKERFEAEKAVLFSEKEFELAQIKRTAAIALEQVKQEALKSAADARNAAKLEAEAEMSRNVAAAVESQLEAERQLKLMMEEQSSVLAQKDKELAELKSETAVTLEEMKQEAANREAEAREASKKATEAALNEKVTAALEAQSCAEQHLKAVMDEQSTLIAQKDSEFAALKQRAATDLELAKGEANMREQEARMSATKEVEATLNSRITAALEAQANAETRAKEMENALGDRLKAALAEQRVALENDKTQALQKEQSQAFEERQKFQEKLEDLQRQLKKERADDLGEAAELNLEVALRAAFQMDQFQPIQKGVSGADLWQDVIDDKEVCGRIIYDSKNRNCWRNEYVDKLKVDQLDAQGEFAVLSTRVFPAGMKQLALKDGVFIVHPARVVALTTILRDQLIRIHKLQLSAKERSAKTAALYEFITSERCHQIFEQFETLIKGLLDLDVAEKKQHDNIWKKRGEMVKKAERTILVQLQTEIERITADGVGL